MLKLNKNDFNEVRQWMYRNARQIELTLWQYEFENGSKEAVLDALAFYQNEDGGFGNTLEADSWNPNSTPYTTMHAATMLNNIGFTDAQHPVVKGILRFFDNDRTEYFGEDGWAWTIATNDEYPRAPWWNFVTTSHDNTIVGFGLTAEIIGFILTTAEQGSSVYKKAENLVKKIVELSGDSEMHGEDGGSLNALGVTTLAETLQKLDLLDKLNATSLPENAKIMVAKTIETDSSKWAEYGSFPHFIIETPDNMHYQDYQVAIEKELDYLIETRPEKSVWGISWTWFDNMAQYASNFAVSENWWKSYHAIWKMRFLRNFDRLEK